MSRAQAVQLRTFIKETDPEAFYLLQTPAKL